MWQTQSYQEKYLKLREQYQNQYQIPSNTGLITYFREKMTERDIPFHQLGEAWPTAARVPEFASLVAKNMGGAECCV
jgi:hypothetical protein